MSAKTHELKDKTITALEAGKQAFDEAKAKAQSQIDVTTAEVAKLRAELKTQAAEVKSKTMARIDKLTKDLHAMHKANQDGIEARLDVLHTEIGLIEAELKHASAVRKMEAEAKAKAIHEEYESARKALMASFEADLAELKEEISEDSIAAAGTKETAKAAIQTKLVDFQAKYDEAQKKLQALTAASSAAFGELHRGVRTAIGEVKKSVHRAHAGFSAAAHKAS